MRRTLPAITIFGLALAVRVFYLWEIRDTPLVEVLLIDSETYDRLARLILQRAFHGEEVYSMNIVYPYFLAAIFAVAKGSLWAVLGVQALLDSLTCVLTYGIGARLFDRRVGLLAGVVLAAYGPMVFYSGALLTPTLITFLVVAMVAVLVGYRFRPRWGTAVAAGLILGLAVLGRGNNLLFVLSGLCNQDKHRKLNPISTIQGTEYGGFGHIRGHAQWLDTPSPDQYRIVNLIDAEPGIKINFAINIGLSNVEALAQRPLVPALSDLAGTVDSVIDLFR